MKTCRFVGCERSNHAYGLCSAHARKFVAAGKPSDISGLGPIRDRAKPGHKANCKIDGCGRPSDSLGLCAGHRMRLRSGVPLHTPLKPRPEERLAFLGGLKGHDGDECIMWPYAKGRGSIRYGGRQRTASNAMCEIAYGPPQPGHEVAHSCNRGDEGCVNPRHLRWATHTENMGDKFVHGTQPRGETHYKSVITAEIALAIFNAGEPHPAVAKRFGVSRSVVATIKSGASWSHVTGYRKRLRKLDLIQKTPAEAGV